MLTSIDLNLDNGELTVTGTSGDDIIQLRGSTDFQSFTVTINQELTNTYDYADISKLTVFALDDDDNVTNTLLIDTIVFGGAGEEIIEGGYRDDVLFGGGGADIIFGRNGDDELRGYLGDDSLNGGNGMDSLFGDSGDDVLHGGAGNDRLFGGGDQLFGGAGDDRFFGGDGVDRIEGGGDSDVIHLDGLQQDFSFSMQGADTVRILDLRDEEEIFQFEREGTNFLVDVEEVIFSDEEGLGRQPLEDVLS